MAMAGLPRKGPPAVMAWGFWTLIAGIFLVSVLSVIQPGFGQAIWPCPLKTLTGGLPCPTCGVTRSVSALLHGNVPLAIRYHPLTLPIVAATLFWWPARKRFPGPMRRFFVWLGSKAGLFTALSLLAVVWIIKLSGNQSYW